MNSLLWTLAAAASAEVVRLGYFGEAQPFQVACARGWFDFSDVEVACLPQASGGFVVSKLDEGDLEVALLGSTPAAFAVARGVDIKNIYVAHEKGSSQGLLVRPEIQSPPDLDERTFGTPFGSTAHYHMMYIQTLFPDVRFDIIDLNGLNPLDLYDAGTIDGAFVWGGWIDGLVQRNATMLFPARGGARIKFHGTFMRVDSVRMARSDGWTPSTRVHRHQERERRENERWHRRRNTTRGRLTKNKQAQVLSDWGKPTFNTISARADFAARRPDVLERIAGVIARLDADYLDDTSTRWGAGAGGFVADVAAAYGASASPTQAELDTAAAGLSYFSFVSPDTMQGPDYLGGGIAAALKATARFHLETNTVAAVAPAGTVDEDALYAATTSAQSLADGLASIPASVLDTAGTGVTSIPESADSTCSGTVDLTATTGTLTDGATTSYSNNLACEWRIASGGVVELTFTVFRVWTGDVVEVFDGSALVARLHGFDRAWPPLRATGDMTVKFTTDGVTERAFNYVLTDGWSASYDAGALVCAADHSTCGNGKCDAASGLCTCDAGYGGADCSLATCLGTTTLTSPTGEFRSSPTAPDRDEPYPNSAECHFVADVGTSFGYVSFTVTYDVEPTFDFVSVNSGDITWARLSGEDTATILVPATDGKASLVFTSDSRGRRGGFRATYVAKSVACASNADCGGHGTCDDGGTCVCDTGYGGLACTVPHCLDGAPKVTGESMVMVSQAPGEPVPAAADCTWEFQAAAGRSVRVVVETLDLEPYRSAAKEGDKVVIRSADAADIELTSTSFQKSYDIASSGISLSLETDRNDVGETYGGFKATAYAVDACPVVGGECTDQGFTCEPTNGLQGPGCYDGGRAVGCTCDLTGCPEGNFFDESTGGCEACPPGTFKSATGPTPCEPCPKNFYAPESGAAMCCRHGYVLVDGFCRQCGQNVGAYVLKGARCNAANGTTVATLEVKEHFFRFSPESTSVYRCPEDDDACRGSSPGLEGYGNGLCKPHAYGPLCMLCRSGYFRNSKTKEDLKAVSECVRCDRIGEQMKQLLTVLLMIVAWALVILGIRRLRSRFNRQWFEAVLIQFVYFAMTMSRFVSIHQVPLPGFSQLVMRALDVFTFDLSSLHSIAQCYRTYNYFHFLMLATLGAPALLLVFIVCAVVRAVARVVACGAPAAPQNALAEEGAAAEAVPLHRRVAAAVRQDLGGVLSKWMLLISLFHSAICCAIFQIFNCTVKYEPFDRKFLVSDYSIRCSGPGYKAHKAYAIVCAVIYVTFPLCLFLVLWRPRRLAAGGEEQRKDPRHVDDGALAFLTNNLKAEYWWFEVLAIFLRSLVTGFFRFKADVKISIVLCLIVTIIHRTFVLQLKPYASSGLQHVVEALMRFALSIVLLSVCLVGDLIEDSENALWMVTLVFLLNVASLPLAYQAFVSESYRGVARRLQAHEPVEAEEVEELLRSAHAEAIREDVRKRSRQILREAFDGKLSEKDWTYFTGTLLALEGVWAPEVHAEEVLQWHVESMLARAKQAGGDGAIDAGAVERSVDIVAGPLAATLTEECLSPTAAFERLRRAQPPGGAPITLLRVYAEVLKPFFELDDQHPQKLWHSRKENPVLHLAALARNKSDQISTSLANLHSPPKSPTSPSSFSLSRSSSGVSSARSLLREASDPDDVAPTREENLASGLAKFRRATTKIQIVRAFASAREPRRLERFVDLALIAHDLNQQAQARIAEAAAKVLDEPHGADVVALKSFDNGTDQPALRSAELVAFKDKVGGAALESEFDASVCVGALHDLANAAFPAFKKALEKLFPPGTEGVELECAADVAIKKKTRMRAKVDEYRREDKPWPRAEKLGDCLRASVVVEGAEQLVAAYEALAKDDIFKVVRLKNKLAERVKPFNLLVNLAFQPPAPPGLAPLIVEVQIVPKAIYDKQKASHRLYSIARASNYASFRGKKVAVDTAPEAADDGGDVEAPAAVRPGRHAEVARRPSLMSLPSFLSWTRTSTRPVVAPAPAPRLDAPT